METLYIVETSAYGKKTFYTLEGKQELIGHAYGDGFGFVELDRDRLYEYFLDEILDEDDYNKYLGMLEASDKDYIYCYDISYDDDEYASYEELHAQHGDNIEYKLAYYYLAHDLRSLKVFESESEVLEAGYSLDDWH